MSGKHENWKMLTFIKKTKMSNEIVQLLQQVGMINFHHSTINVVTGQTFTTFRVFQNKIFTVSSHI